MIVLVSVFVSACKSDQTYSKHNNDIREAEERAESLKLNRVLDNYFDESLRINPVYATFVGVNKYNDQFSAPINEASLARQLALEIKYLAEIKSIDHKMLSGQDLLSHEIFLLDRQMAIRGAKFQQHLIPINQMWGAHNFFAMLGSGGSAQPFETHQDYLDFQKRSTGFALYMDSVVAAMRQGIEKGVVLPKPIVVKLFPQFEAHIVDDIEKSVFYGPIKQLATNNNIADPQKAQLKKSHIETINKVILPTYRKTLIFLQNEYLPNARDSVGLSALPNGKAWYEYKIAENTTLPLTSEEIHQFGLQEVERILNEMRKVKESVGFNGNLQEFFTFLKEDEQFYWNSEQEVIDAYTLVKDDINLRVSKLFNIFPNADYQVKAVEPYRAASSAGASYQSPSVDGSRPGTFYINTFDLKAQPRFLKETLSIHEAAPGHHFQISIQQEVEGLHKFRKYGGYTVFAEGWALYAESLGKEMGLFTDPYQWYGRLSDEQLRAMRLVVDTGLHAFGWTREQAIEYMSTNSSLAPSDIEAEVERYISIPGQAVSYKVGERKIAQLRDHIKSLQGEQFDIKEFHTQILIDGAVPMPILESKLKRWVNATNSN